MFTKQTSKLTRVSYFHLDCHPRSDPTPLLGTLKESYRRTMLPMAIKLPPSHPTSPARTLVASASQASGSGVEFTSALDDDWDIAWIAVPINHETQRVQCRRISGGNKTANIAETIILGPGGELLPGSLAIGCQVHGCVVHRRGTRVCVEAVRTVANEHLTAGTK
ncbi:hypothetical protein JB92DRAFT_2825481 [Gautieria morchelliformis]|nr:hypothetical protein JB92DRAFT_2825481 [Gautieria morchelliformis]